MCNLDMLAFTDCIMVTSVEMGTDILQIPTNGPQAASTVASAVYIMAWFLNLVLCLLTITSML